MTTIRSDDVENLRLPSATAPETSDSRQPLKDDEASGLFAKSYRHATAHTAIVAVCATIGSLAGLILGLIYFVVALSAACFLLMVALPEMFLLLRRFIFFLIEEAEHMVESEVAYGTQNDPEALFSANVKRKIHFQKHDRVESVLKIVTTVIRLATAAGAFIGAFFKAKNLPTHSVDEIRVYAIVGNIIAWTGVAIILTLLCHGYAIYKFLGSKRFKDALINLLLHLFCFTAVGVSSVLELIASNNYDDGPRADIIAGVLIGIAAVVEVLRQTIFGMCTRSQSNEEFPADESPVKVAGVGFVDDKVIEAERGRVQMAAAADRSSRSSSVSSCASSPETSNNNDVMIVVGNDSNASPSAGSSATPGGSTSLSSSSPASSTPDSQTASSASVQSSGFVQVASSKQTSRASSTPSDGGSEDPSRHWNRV